MTTTTATYVVKSLPEPTWWERGTLRCCVLSYRLRVTQIRRNFQSA